MKRAFSLCCVILIAVMVARCRRGNVQNVEYSIGTSKKYTQKQLQSAVSTVKSTFERDFPGCTLNRLSYIESDSDRITQARTSGCLPEVEQSAKNGSRVIIFSDFDTDADVGSLGLNSSCQYTSYQWLLAFNGSGWDILSRGY